MPFDPKSLQGVLEAAAPSAGLLMFRPMFGGIMAYADGRPFASLSNVGLALKLDEAGRRDLLAVESAKPLQYEADSPPSKSYVVVPDAMHADVTALAAWVTRSIAAVRAAPSIARTRTKPRKKAGA